MASYEPVIGLEIHCELMTKSKIFCSCENSFGKNTNSHICPVCAGFPGAMPTLNKEAVTLAVKAGLAMNCKINNYSSFDRKNYFYPDLPKAYQITQFFHPICSDGYISLFSGKKIRINRIHLEEDAGKLIHNGKFSHADYNRCGVPLIEIVTEPDFSSSDEVREFVRKIALLLKYADVCDGRMEQGSLRVDVNISVKEKNSDTYGTRAELKNINSLKFIAKAIEFETKRQSDLLQKGKKVVRETRRYDEAKNATFSLRCKEDAQDYRYFPEPDLPPIIISDEEIDNIKNQMCEMPDKRFERLTKLHLLSNEDAELIIQSRDFSDFYDKTAKITNNYRQTANMMLGEISRLINVSGKSISQLTLTPDEVAGVITMQSSGKLTANNAKKVIEIMSQSGQSASEIIQTHNLLTNSNKEEICVLAKKIIDENPSQVLQFKDGNEKLFGFFMGQLIRESGGSADPQIIREILTDMLK